MNRDEARSRSEENIIKENRNKDTLYYYPIDKSSGGTWFGFNSHGIVLALLNRYQNHRIKNLNSRGLIIPQLLQYKNQQQIYQELIKSDLSKYQPFDLVLNKNNSVIEHSWNGKKLSVKKYSQPYFITSSSIDTEHVLHYRQLLFNKFKAINAKQILQELHLNQELKDTSTRIFMSRKDTHTKSISRIIYNKNSLDYQYINEGLLANYLTKPQSQRLQLEL